MSSKPKLQGLVATLALAAFLIWSEIASTTSPEPTPEAPPAAVGVAGEKAEPLAGKDPGQAAPTLDAAGLPFANEKKPAFSPMHLEILEALEEERTSMEALYSQLAQTPDPQTVIEIQGRIQRLKEETELTILDIQLRHARKAGRSDVVLQLERVIQAIKAPKQARVPLQRPAPEAKTSRPGR